MPVVNAGGFCLGWSSAWIYNTEHDDVQPTCWQAPSLTYTIVINAKLVSSVEIHTHNFVNLDLRGHNVAVLLANLTCRKLLLFIE